MLPAHVNAVGRLTHDVPTLWLNRGDVGAIGSIWMSPTDHYEVEFHRLGQSSVRALLDSQLFELIGPEPGRAGHEAGSQSGSKYGLSEANESQTDEV